MLQTELTISETTERLTEELKRLPFDDFLSSLEAALLERQADSEDEAFRNFAIDIREFQARDYEPCDINENPVPGSRGRDFQMPALPQGPPLPKAA